MTLLHLRPHDLAKAPRAPRLAAPTPTNVATCAEPLLEANPKSQPLNRPGEAPESVFTRMTRVARAEKKGVAIRCGALD